MDTYVKNQRKKRYAPKVYLVGSGPGDPGLLTVKGYELLQEADAVICDALAGDPVLAWISPAARQVDVGKRGGQVYLSQDRINRLLVEEGKKGGTVVRLKGGDPFVFGRGSEEAKVLEEAGIPYEIVPGVSSATAVPAYCGIPITRRGVASSLHVITGHREAGKEEPLNYEALASVGGTLLFLMAVSSAPQICQGLLDAGMAPETPAAFLQEGTTASQRRLLSTLSRIIEDGRQAGVTAPALLLVGPACKEEELCLWWEKRPLAGKRILVTRPRERASYLADRLRGEGGEVTELPTICIKKRKPEREALLRCGESRWLVFTSPAGVDCFFEDLTEERIDVRAFADCRFAVIGPATGEALWKRGICFDLMPEQYYGEALGNALAEAAEPEDRITLCRAAKGGEALSQILKEAHLEVEELVLYDTEFPEDSLLKGRVKSRLSRGELDYVTFTSASTVRGFLTLLEPSEEEKMGFTAVCIGAETEKAAAAAGLRCLTAEAPTMEHLIEAICRHASEGASV